MQTASLFADGVFRPELEEILAQGKKREARHRETIRLYDELKKGCLQFPEISDAAERARSIDLQKQLRSELNRLNKEAEDEEYFPPHIADAINLLRNERSGDGKSGVGTAMRNTIERRRR